MLYYAIRRCLLAAVIVLLALLVLFSLLQALPGDPISIALGPRATPEVQARYIEKMGLDEPLYVQFAMFAWNAAQGDFGADIFSGKSVAVTVLEQLRFTLVLAVCGLSWAALAGIPLGCLAATRPGSWMDRITGVLSVGTIAVPSFLVSIWSLLLFGLVLGWFPIIGAGEPDDRLDQLHHLVLPSFAVGLGWVGYLARMVRASMLEVMGENYIRAARALGLSRNRIVYGYALRIAVLPTITLIGMGFGSLLSGAVFAEIIFSRPGRRPAHLRHGHGAQLPGGAGGGAGDHRAVRVRGAGRRSRGRGAGPARPPVALMTTRTHEKAAAAERPDERPRGTVWREFARKPLGLVSLALVLLFIGSAVLAPLLAPYPPNKIDIPHRMEGPTLAHVAGTDQLGRDTFSRVLYGGRVALYVAGIGVSASLAIGLLLGMLAGYGPRWLDNLLLLVFDTIRSFPTIMLALAVVALTGPSLTLVLAIVIVTSIPGYGRVARTATLSIKSDGVHPRRAVPRRRARSRAPPPHHAERRRAAPDPRGDGGPGGGHGRGGAQLPRPRRAAADGELGHDPQGGLRRHPRHLLAGDRGGIPLVLTTLGFTFFAESLRDAIDPKLRLRR